MFLHKDKIPTVLNEYLHKVMIPKSPSSLQTFLSSIAVGAAIRKINAMISDPKISPTMVSLGVIDSAGNINLDELHRVLDDAIKSSGAINIPIIDYNIDSSDFNSIFEIAKQHSTGGVNGTSTVIPRDSF